MRIYLILILFVPLFSFGQSDPISTIVEKRLDHESENPVHSILVHIEKPVEGFTYSKGFGKLVYDLFTVSMDVYIE